MCTPPTCASETWAPLSLPLGLGGSSHQLTVRTWAQVPERSEAAGAGEDLAVGSFIPAEGITRQRRPSQDPTGPGWPGVLTEGSEPLPLQPSRGLSLSRSHPDPFCPNTHQRHRRWPGHRRSFHRGLAAEVVRTRLGAQLGPFQVGRPARPLVLPRDPLLLTLFPVRELPVQSAALEVFSRGSDPSRTTQPAPEPHISWFLPPSEAASNSACPSLCAPVALPRRAPGPVPAREQRRDTSHHEPGKPLSSLHVPASLSQAGWQVVMGGWHENSDDLGKLEKRTRRMRGGQQTLGRAARVPKKLNAKLQIPSTKHVEVAWQLLKNLEPPHDPAVTQKCKPVLSRVLVHTRSRPLCSQQPRGEAARASIKG